MNKIKKFFQDIFTPEVEYILPIGQPQPYKPMASQIPEDYTVQIINHFDDNGDWSGSHIEPALSSIVDASDLDRLRWRAASVNARHPELQIRINEGNSSVNGVRENGVFAINARNSVTTADFNSAWTLLTGMERGADIIKESIWHLDTPVKEY